MIVQGGKIPWSEVMRMMMEILLEGIVLVGAMVVE
jgi:hypothetical protein